MNQSFPWPAKAQDYENTTIGDALRRIFDALGALRGYRDFVKSAVVPPCDYVIFNPPFILEFDENQHFTRPRLTSLSFYPPELKTGFPISHWQELCRSINAVDDEPIDRDERRAWYDTLRDLVPTLHGFRPTVRLHANEYHWCALNSALAKDRETFAKFLQGRLPDSDAKFTL